MNRMLSRERRAEEWAQRVHLELLSAFDRAQHGHGFTESAIWNKAEGLAATRMSRLKDDYLRKARREYRRRVRAQTAGIAAGGIDSLWADPGLDQVFVRSITGLFPLEQSATLRKLIDTMVEYEITVVLPAIETAS